MSDERRDPAQPDRRRVLRNHRIIIGRRSTDIQPEWLSVTEYATTYGVSRAQVYKWLASNILITYRVESLLRIRNLPPPDHFSIDRVSMCSPAKTRT